MSGHGSAAATSTDAVAVAPAARLPVIVAPPTALPLTVAFAESEPAGIVTDGVTEAIDVAEDESETLVGVDCAKLIEAVRVAAVLTFT